MMRGRIKFLAAGLGAAAMALTGCSARPAGEHAGEKAEAAVSSPSSGTAGLAFGWELDPASLALSLKTPDGGEIVLKMGQEPGRAQFEEREGAVHVSLPDKEAEMEVRQEEDFLSVSITSLSEEEDSFTWPVVSAEQYYLPLGEGKRVDGANPVWREYLEEEALFVPEQLSMPFFAAVQGDFAVLAVMETPFHTFLEFSGDDELECAVRRDFPAIGGQRESRFRIYLTENDPVQAAKCYRDYVEGQGRLVTLEEKAQDNPQIEKLYGAPFVYLWGDFIISPQDIDWQAFIRSLDSPAMDYLADFAGETETGGEYLEAAAQIREQGYAAEYQKNLVCRYISEALRLPGFGAPGSPLGDGLKTDGEEMTQTERLSRNKEMLAQALPQVFGEADGWMEEETSGLIRDMRGAGIERAWIGLNSWEQAYANPEMAEAAGEAGYLFASYDSYHSIHEPGKEQWITAKFADESLYEEASVTGKDGKKAVGFQGVGRKLNPALSMPAVKERMEGIMENNIDFTSWFIDCDATGEVLDDYTPGHETSQEEDAAARLERMAYIRDAYGLVIGSEGGSDFAAPVIAFAHGIELPSFSWRDPDMKENRESPYYIGAYYSPYGGVADHFSKRVPIKEKFDTLFADPRYDLPLYRLVYNDCVITTYHWDWPTFKIQGKTRQRMLREVLYNVPPLYHLDAKLWQEYREDITAHTKVWSAFARQAVTMEMTGFTDLSGDGLVQKTVYGNGALEAVANFGEKAVTAEGKEIPGGSVWMRMGEEERVYTPGAVHE